MLINGVDEEELVRLHGLGLSDGEIADKIGMSKNGAARRLRKLGLPPHVRPRKRGPVLPVTGRAYQAPDPDPAEVERMDAPDASGVPGGPFGVRRYARTRCPVQVGERIRFRPHAWEAASGAWGGAGRGVESAVNGTVTEINPEHRWYAIEYECNGYHLRETFKF